MEQNKNHTQEDSVQNLSEELDVSEASVVAEPKVRRRIKISKKARILVLIVFALVASIIALIVIKNSIEDSKTPQAAQNQEAPKNTQEEESLKQVSESIVEYEGIEGLYFEVPDDWSLTKNVYADDMKEVVLTSNDAIGAEDGYELLMKGTAVRLRVTNRDQQMEAESSDPLDAYISNIGAPKIEDPSKEHHEREIDRSKIYVLRNINGIDIQYYTWAYEGCIIDGHFLNATKHYSVQVTTADGCPNPELFKDDGPVSSILQSLQYTDSPKITAKSVVTTDYTRAVEGRTIVQLDTNAISVSLTQQYLQEFGARVPGGASNIVIAHTVNNSFDKLVFGPTQQVLKDFNSRYCSDSQCGFDKKIYDANLRIVPSASFDTLTKLTDSIYGEISDEVPIINGNFARRYTYYVKTAKGVISTSMIVEVKEKGNLFELNDALILNTIKSISVNE